MKAMILPDQETKFDLLNNEAIAITIADLIRGHSDIPVTLGVHGDWGAGKSSILEMVQAGFEDDKDVLCIKFNGWRFQGFEDAKVVLLEGIVDELVQSRSLTTNSSEQVKQIFRRIDWLKVAKNAGGLAWTASTGIPTPDQVQHISSAIQKLTTNPSKNDLESAASIFESSFGEMESRRVPKEVEEFRKEFDELLKLAKVKQLVVLVDDLDRCLPETTIETLEAIRLFVFTSKTAFVIAADEAMIEYSVRKHFPDLPGNTKSRSYARSYLEKLIQIPFRIPALGVCETRIYTTLLLVGVEIGVESPEYLKLTEKARTILQRPWLGKVITQEHLREAVGTSIPGPVQQAFNVAEQIGSVLAAGTYGNPRQIKRFINSLLLRKQIATARKIDEINIPILAKLMIAERFQTKLFEHISIEVNKSTSGVCTDIGLIENFDNRTTVKQSKKKAVPRTKPSNELPEWLREDDVLSWGRTQPSLKDTDLRPYLFVTKDRGGYMEGAGGASHLDEIVSKLMAGEMTARGVMDQVRLCTHEDQEAIFETIRGHILQKGEFQSRPSCIHGLILFCKIHAQFQLKLVEFLGTLPVEQLGIWVTTGWKDVFVEGDASKKFHALLDSWEKQEENNTLKAAAVAAKSLSRGNN